MNGEMAKMLANYLTQGYENEVSITKKVIQNVPDEKKAYKPDPKSMPPQRPGFWKASPAANSKCLRKTPRGRAR
jgi:hypothetical protein